MSGGVDLAGVLDRRRADLERERREVDRRLAALDIQVELAAGSGRPDVVVRPVEAELIATLAADPDDDLERAFYELEAIVRDLGIRARRPPGALVDADGARAFVPVRRVAPEPRLAFRAPAGRAGGDRDPAGLVCDPAGDPPGARAWVAAAGFEPSGPLRVLYLQFGGEPELALPEDYLVDRSADFVTELQLPVA